MWTDGYLCKPGVLSRRVSEGQREGAKKALLGILRTGQLEVKLHRSTASHLVAARAPPPEPGRHLSPAYDALHLLLVPPSRIGLRPPPAPRPQELSPARPRLQRLFLPLAPPAHPGTRPWASSGSSLFPFHPARALEPRPFPRSQNRRRKCRSAGCLEAAVSLPGAPCCGVTWVGLAGRISGQRAGPVWSVRRDLQEPCGSTAFPDLRG